MHFIVQGLELQPYFYKPSGSTKCHKSDSVQRFFYQDLMETGKVDGELGGEGQFELPVAFIKYLSKAIL